MLSHLLTFSLKAPPVSVQRQHPLSETVTSPFTVPKRDTFSSGLLVQHATESVPSQRITNLRFTFTHLNSTCSVSPPKVACILELTSEYEQICLGGCDNKFRRGVFNNGSNNRQNSTNGRGAAPPELHLVTKNLCIWMAYP